MAPAALILLAPFLAQGQELPLSGLRRGDRIRVTDTRGRAREGTFTSTRGDTLLWRPGATGASVPAFQPLPVPFLHIGILERSGGEERFGWTGFFLTSGAFTLAGGLAMALTSDPCNETGPFSCLMQPRSRGEAFGWGAGVGALVGVPMGIAIGFAMKGERWERVRIPPLTPTVRPLQSGRWSLGLSFPTPRRGPSPSSRAPHATR